jgi:PKD repeat protein
MKTKGPSLWQAVLVSGGIVAFGAVSVSAQPSIGVGETVNGTLVTGAPPGRCLPNVPTDRYRLAVTTAGVVTIELSSAAFDTYVCVLDANNNGLGSDDNSGPASNSRFYRQFTPGSYYVEVSTRTAGNGGGAYTLETYAGLPRPIGAIGVGQTLNGSLSSTAAETPCLLNVPADRYLLTIASAGVVTIEVSSAAFDTYVCVLDANNSGLGSDDNSGPASNSRFYRQFTPGSYYVEVSTRTAGNGGGAYTLETYAGLPRPIGAIGVGQTLNGSLSSTAAETPCLLNVPADRYLLTIASAGVVTIEVSSAAFDTYVCVLDANNSGLGSDDNSGPASNSRFYRQFTPGSYYVEVSTRTAGNGGGAYTLATYAGYPWPIGTIGVGETLSATLSPTAAETRCLPNAPGDRYGFTLSTVGTIVLGAASAAFDTYLCLLDSSNNAIASDDNSGGGTNSRITRANLPAGTYFVEVATRTSGPTGGPYTLSLSAEALPAFSIDDVSLTEGDGGTRSAVFTVTLSRALAQSVSVSYSTSNDTASSGSDYAASSGSLSFAASTTTRTVSITVNGDTVPEPDETFKVTLSNPSTGVVLLKAQSVGTIVNDDPFVSVSPASGPPGTRFLLAGSGFTPGQGVTRHLRRAGQGELPVVQVPTDSAGRFSHTIDSAAYPAGSYETKVVDNISGRASPWVQFQVLSTMACMVTCTATGWAGPVAQDSLFTATATPLNCNAATSFSWTFGDGGTSSLRNPTHVYATAGEYRWSMTATAGGTCTKTGLVTVLGPVARLYFAPVGSPQAEGRAFPVSVEARDAGGDPVGFDGTVTFTSPMTVSPARVQMRDGRWQGQMTFRGCGMSLFLNAGAVGTSSGARALGSSNEFAVACAGSGLGGVGGQVFDELRRPVEGAVVKLRVAGGGAPATSVTSGTSGTFFVPGLLAGSYDGWAELGGVSSPMQPVRVSDGATVTFNPSMALHRDTAHTPVILVPGILGSAMRGSAALPPDPGREYPALRGSLKVWNGDESCLLRDYSGWDSLKAQLRAGGYLEGSTLFDCPYDWRIDLSEGVGRYLVPCIDFVKLETKSPKVDVIAHSMGGLLVRAYVEDLGSRTDGSPIFYDIDGRRDLRRVAFVGTPHRGAAVPYYLWEGGDPQQADLVQGAAYYYLYARTSQLQYSHLVGPLEQKCTWGACSVVDPPAQAYRNLYRGWIRTIGQLLHPPEMPYLRPGPRPHPSSDFLALLEDRVGLLGERLGAIGTFVGWGADDAHAFDSTVTSIPVGRPSALYYFGAPLPLTPSNMGPGDQTVPKASGRWLYDRKGLGQPPIAERAEHGRLIGAMKTHLCSFLTSSSCVPVDDRGSRDLDAATRVLQVAIRGRAQPYLRSPTGTAVGVEPGTGAIAREVLGAEIALDNNGGSLTLPDPSDGTYVLVLQTSHDEDYSLTVAYSGATGRQEREHRIFGRAGEVRTLWLTVNEAAVSPVAVVEEPAMPLALTATALARGGGIQTRLAWSPSATTGVVAYNVYAQDAGEAVFSQLGTATTTLLDTGLPWSTDPSIPTRFFAVTAVKADGTESFLGDIVANDDRDHDGVADYVEVERGSNPDDPDSDHDRLGDADELKHGTDPLAADTDGDRYSDVAEVLGGSDPLDPQSVPRGDGGVERRRRR